MPDRCKFLTGDMVAQNFNVAPECFSAIEILAPKLVFLEENVLRRNNNLPTG